MLALFNVTIDKSNWEKKIRKPLNVTKVQSHVMLVLPNVTIRPSNVRGKKGTTECDKSTVRCNIGIA